MTQPSMVDVNLQAALNVRRALVTGKPGKRHRRADEAERNAGARRPPIDLADRASAARRGFRSAPALA